MAMADGVARWVECAMLDWVCSVTGARAASRVERVQSLWGGYGEIVRVALEGAEVRSVIVKQVTPPPSARMSAPERRSHERKLRSYRVEAAFYRAHAPRSEARVPHCHAAEAVEGGFRFVLEDLDAAGFDARHRRGAETEIDRCLAWLAAFHASFMGEAPSELWPVGTYWHLETRPDERASMPRGALEQAADAIDRALTAAQHQTLVHGDAKPANFCFGQRGVAAVDFQYVGAGCGMKDVVYLASCIDARRLHERMPRMLDHYFAQLRGCLRPRLASGAIDAIEAEWRALVPLAWADFERFLCGWAPGHRPSGYGEAMCRAALEAIAANR